MQRLSCCYELLLQPLTGAIVYTAADGRGEHTTCASDRLLLKTTQGRLTPSIHSLTHTAAAVPCAILMVVAVTTAAAGVRLAAAVIMDAVTMLLLLLPNIKPFVAMLLLLLLLLHNIKPFVAMPLLLLLHNFKPFVTMLLLLLLKIRSNPLLPCLLCCATLQ